MLFHMNYSVIILLLVIILDQHQFISGNNSIFAIKTKDSVYISSTTTISHNGVTLLDNFEWIRKIGNHIIIGLHGDISDCEDCYTWIHSRNKLHELEFNGRSLDCKAIAYLCRNLIASKLRTKERLNVQILVGGYNIHENNPQLYWIDDIGSIQNIKDFAVHGKETPFILSLLDQHLSILNNHNRIVHEDNKNEKKSYDYMELIKNIWLQSCKRSNQRIDMNKVSVYHINQLGCNYLLLKS